MAAFREEGVALCRSIKSTYICDAVLYLNKYIYGSPYCRRPLFIVIDSPVQIDPRALRRITISNPLLIQLGSIQHTHNPRLLFSCCPVPLSLVFRLGLSHRRSTSSARQALNPWQAEQGAKTTPRTAVLMAIMPEEEAGRRKGCDGAVLPHRWGARLPALLLGRGEATSHLRTPS